MSSKRRSWLTIDWIFFVSLHDDLYQLFYSWFVKVGIPANELFGKYQDFLLFWGAGWGRKKPTSTKIKKEETSVYHAMDIVTYILQTQVNDIAICLASKSLFFCKQSTKCFISCRDCFWNVCLQINPTCTAFHKTNLIHF